MKIAVPVETAEALDSVRAEHFGHAPLFAVAEFEGSAIVGGGVYDSVSHDEFGCAGIAEYVASALGADVVVVREISRDARAWLAGHEVEVVRVPDADARTAADALRGYLQGRAQPVPVD